MDKILVSVLVFFVLLISTNNLNSQETKSEDVYVDIPEIKVIDSTFVDGMRSLILKYEFHKKTSIKNTYAYVVYANIDSIGTEISVMLAPPFVWDKPEIYCFRIDGALFIIPQDNLLNNLFCLTGKTEKIHYMNYYINMHGEFVLLDKEISERYRFWILSYDEKDRKIIQVGGQGIPMSEWY